MIENDNASIPNVAAVYSADTLNVGDENSNPVLYFNFGRDVSRIPWPEMRKGYSAKNLVIGGGFLGKMLDGDENYFSVSPKVENLFIWGIGHNPDSVINNDILEKCTLLGIREYNHKDIDNKKVFYVPCASCMSPLFDIPWEERHETVFFMHSHTSSVTKKLNIGDRPYMKNRTNFVDTIRFIASGRTVVTNSYHGAYYATLLGKKVIVLAEEGQWKTFRPEKFKCFKFTPTFSEAGLWEEAAKEARSYPEALLDSRASNISFYKMVLDRMQCA